MSGKRYFYVLLTALFIFQLSCGAISSLTSKDSPEPVVTASAKVRLGVEVLLEKQLSLLEGKRVGLITNQSGVNSNLQSTVDILYNHPDINLTTLFAPEHGIRGDIQAGETVATYTDPKTGVTVYSLYGSIKKPTEEMLEHVDVLMFDIQDIGVRPYTYIYTMAYGMEAAQEAGIEFILLDRPNPLGGIMVEGSVLDPEFKSFIGRYPIPYVHGMTTGELAWLFNMEFGIGAKLTVVPIEGWSRDMSWEETELKWIPTSPHIPEPTTPAYFATTGCLGELGVFHIGVGYTMPFKLTGAPWINAEELTLMLNNKNLPGVSFRPMHWQPLYGKWTDKQVNGVQLHIDNVSIFKPFSTGIHIMEAIRDLYPNQEIFPEQRLVMFNRAAGTDQLFKKLKAGVPAEVIINSFQNDLVQFMKLRAEYLLY